MDDNVVSHPHTLVHNDRDHEQDSYSTECGTDSDFDDRESSTCTNNDNIEEM